MSPEPDFADLEKRVRDLEIKLGTLERNGLNSVRNQNIKNLFAPPMDITTTTGHTH